MRGFGEIFKDTFNEYTEKFIHILKIFVFLYMIPVVVFSLILMVLFVGTYSSLGLSFLKTGSFDLSEIVLNQETFLSLIPLFGGIFVFYLLLGIFYFLAAISYIHTGFSKMKDISFDKSFAFARKNFWRFVGLTLLTILCITPLFILLIIPGIIFWVFWAFSPYLLLSGNDGAWDSMKKSKTLVKGRWWNIFGCMLLLFIIMVVVSSVAGLIPFIGHIISSLVLTPFMILFFKNFYLDLKSGMKK
ncbi:MAG: hypothetical protein AABW51_03790 [Nanoarchaeota archaeon]